VVAAAAAAAAVVVVEKDLYYSVCKALGIENTEWYTHPRQYRNMEM